MTGGSPPAETEKTMPEIGARRLASGIGGSVEEAIGKATDEMRLVVAASITELVAEIREGGENVKRALQAEAAGVREDLKEIVGNATASAEDAVKKAADAAQAASDAKQAAEAKANGHAPDDAATQQPGAG